MLADGVLGNLSPDPLSATLGKYGVARSDVDLQFDMKNYLTRFGGLHGGLQDLKREQVRVHQGLPIPQVDWRAWPRFARRVLQEGLLYN